MFCVLPNSRDREIFKKIGFFLFTGENRLNNSFFAMVINEESMSMQVEYRQDTDPELIAKARARFGDEINHLRAFGFLELSCYTELLPKYSLLSHLYIFALAKMNRELIRVESPLRLVMSQPLLFNRVDSTYALVFGLGVKFYSIFTDGTGVISANFASRPIQDMQWKLYKFPESRSMEACWQAHQQEIAGFIQMGRQVDDAIDFEKYVSISKREELA